MSLANSGWDTWQKFHPHLTKTRLRKDLEHAMRIAHEWLYDNDIKKKWHVLHGDSCLYSPKKIQSEDAPFDAFIIYHLYLSSLRLLSIVPLASRACPRHPRTTLPQRMSCPPGDELAYVTKLKRFLPPRQKQQQPTTQPTNQPTNLT